MPGPFRVGGNQNLHDPVTVEEMVFRGIQGLPGSIGVRVWMGQVCTLFPGETLRTLPEEGIHRQRN